MLLQSLLLRPAHTTSLAALLAAACIAPAALGQAGEMKGMEMSQSQAMPSPPATATVTLAGKTLTVKYNTPHMRGRKIMGDVVPYDQIWRTGANPATTLVTPVSLHIGNLLVPAGTYTVFTLPGREKWILIINKQTKQWGLEYHPEMDLGRVEMKAKTLPSAQEVMSISFDDIKRDSAELHIRWATTDEYVKVSTP